VFHVEIRQFPHVARAFNLSEQELDRQITAPWAQALPFEFQDRRWTPSKAKLTIYEGPALDSADIGIGRGWGNVTRTSTDVTAARLSAPRPDAVVPEFESFRAALVTHAAQEPLTAADAMAVARERWPEATPEELAAVSARAIWQLLAEGSVAVARADSS
jgi:hypothetical protein